jgi:hypothetical protein
MIANVRTMKLLGIDVGYRNLALVLVDYSQGEITREFCERIDITEYCCDHTCELEHTSHIVDYIDHVIQRHRGVFDRADTILIERQPPGGLVAVESLLYSKFRKKSILISPNSMHVFLQINHLDYDNRKLEVVKLAGMSGKGRLHDMADAYLMTKFYIDTVLKPIENRNRPMADLDLFKY